MRSSPAWIWVALLLSACPGERSGERKVCPEACAGLVGPACESNEHATECLMGCARERKLAERATCVPEYDAFLACLGTARRGCKPGESLQRIVQNGVDAKPCQREYDRYAACSLACHEHGVVRHGAADVRNGDELLRVQVEVTSRGCGDKLPQARRGAPEGSRCEHESVCDPVDCPCPFASEGYQTRVCVNSSCAGAALACRVGPEALSHHVCRP